MNSRKTILKLALALTIIGLLFPSSLLAQTSTVSGNLQNLGATAITSSNTYVEFTLRNYGSSLPRVVATAVIVRKPQRFNPDSNGDISGSIYRNDNITPDGTFYRVCVFDNGRRFRCNDYTIAAASFDLSSASPNTTPPVVTAPTRDSTYQRLDGGNNASGNYVPDTIGLNLGSASAQWDVFANLTATNVVYTGANGLLSGDSLFCFTAATNLLGVGVCPATSPLHIVGTSALFDSTGDLGFNLKIDSGSSTAQASCLDLADRGTVLFQVCLTSDGDFKIFDLDFSSSLARFRLIDAGGMTFFHGGAAAVTTLVDNAGNTLATVTDNGTVGDVVITGTLNSAADDEVLVGNGTTMENKAVPDCNTNTADALQYDTGTNAFSCVTHASGYVLQTNTPSINPVDATTYFFGGTPNVPTTSAGDRRILVSSTGTVTRFDLFILISGTAGTAAENSTYDLRLNDTTDFCQITVDHDASVQTSATCSQAVSAGDYLEIKWVGPTWTTNPTVVIHAAAILIQ